MVIVDQIDTGGAILALANAVVQILGAGRTAPTLQAGALERTGQIATRFRIYAGSQAGRDVRLAFIDICE